MDNEKKVKLHDKTFRVMIPTEEIDAAIDKIAVRINSDYSDKDPPCFLGC